MNRPKSLALTLLIVGGLFAFSCGMALTAPEAIAVEDFANTTGDTGLDWLGWALPDALVECLWQLPGVAYAPASPDEPQSHAKYWVYRLTEGEKELRKNPPSDEVRSWLALPLVGILGAADPLDQPAEPQLRLGGAIAGGDGTLSIAISVTDESGKAVHQTSVAADAGTAIVEVPAKAAHMLEPFLSPSLRASAATPPSLGTKSPQAARAYVEAGQLQRQAVLTVFRKVTEGGGIAARPDLAPVIVDVCFPAREATIKGLEGAAALDDKFALPHRDLGWMYQIEAQASSGRILDAKALTTAREHYESAARLGDRSPGTLTGLPSALGMESQLARSSGDTQRANALWDRSIEEWMRAVRLEPHSAWNRRSAADALLLRAVDNTGTRVVDEEAFATAVRLLREAVKLAPDCEAAKEKLRYMESLAHK